MWSEKSIPVIPGLESSSSIEAKRFLDFSLNELLDEGEPVRGAAETLQDREDACCLVIEDIDYPIVRGQPNDKHRDNWFGGLCCYEVPFDYWQQASETLRTSRLGYANGKKGYGDCEDGSILIVDLMLLREWKAFVVFGEVYEGNSLLGGHGWAIFEDEDGRWRLYESTLDIAPSYPEGYPEIDPEATQWDVGGITYAGEMKFNKEVYYESHKGVLQRYLALQVKETKAKYRALQGAWLSPVKPLVRAGFLGKLRRWKR